MHVGKKGGNALDDIANTLHLAELVPAQKIDMHIEPLLHRRNLLVQPPNVEERLHVAPAHDRREPFAQRRQRGNAAEHL